MTEDVSPDVCRAWSKSDVVLCTPNSEGKELHANKAVLSVFSPYFDALFSGRFAESNVSSVEMKCDYNGMKEVLRNIHQVGVSYKSNGQKQYDIQMLKELYFIGDYYNFPHIRKLCLDQMIERPSVEMAIIASNHDLRESVMEILSRLSSVEVRRFLSHTDVKYLFTKKEVLCLFEKLTGKPLPRGSTSSTKPRKPLNLEDVTDELENPRIDLTKPWDMADVAIFTRSSMKRVLYSNNTILNSVSNAFKNLPMARIFMEKEEMSFLSMAMGNRYYACYFQNRWFSSATVDAEFTTMREILSVIHLCDTNYEGPPRTLHPALLHSMYRVASVEQWDIPLIRDLCAAKLLELSSVDSCEVLRSLQIPSKRMAIPVTKLRDWIYREDGHFSYRKGDQVIVVTPSQNQPHFINSLVLRLIDKLSPYVNVVL